MSEELENSVSEMLKEEKWTRAGISGFNLSELEEILDRAKKEGCERRIKEISDEQREEAIQQKRTAEEMRQRSEVERQNALIAQEKAVVSEQQAQDARIVAESERQMAEHQRIQAEFSKRVADTLSYVALGRSLGSLSLVQARLGNTELADLLAYASYLYVNRYNADVYNPTVFQSLMTASQSKRMWARHRGLLMGLANVSKADDRLVTVSTYGEIMLHAAEQ